MASNKDSLYRPISPSIVHSFRDRNDAGTNLVPFLEAFNLDPERLLIVAIPNGGVPVAIPIASHFARPLFVLNSRKVQFLWTTKAGFGAVTADGTTIFNAAAKLQYNMTEEIIHNQVNRALKEIAQREALFNQFLLPLDLNQMEIILVDDGLASGITMHAAILSVQKRRVEEVLVAVPTAQQESAQEISQLSQVNLPFDVEVVSPNFKATKSFAVADAYDDWHNEDSEEILRKLQAYNQRFAESPAEQ